MKYEPQRVSKYFHFDWQFAVDMSQLPLLRPTSFVISLMPLLFESMSTPALIVWWSSISFIISLFIIRFRCPSLIRHYRHYGEYAAQQHSHRWIVWLFYHLVTSLSQYKRIIEETYAKGLSFRVDECRNIEEYRACPLFDIPNDSNIVRVFYPVNIGRDIYIPIHCDGDRRVLVLQEDDPKLAEKEKELFWILFTEMTKKFPVSRFFFWLFFYISIVLLFIMISLMVWRSTF